MSVEHNKTIARRFFDEFLIEGKYDIHDISSAPHLTYHFYGAHSHQSIGRVFREIHQGFTSRSSTVHNLLGEGDWVFLRFSARGNHSAQYRQHAPTNQPVNVEGVILFRFEADQIAEVWHYHEGFDFDVSPK